MVSRRKFKAAYNSCGCIFYVLEGKAEIIVGKEKQEVEANCLVESPKGIPHCISNNTKEDVRMLLVKAPRPTTQTKLL
ncbi:MAG: cupin domain-containing protein [Bacteroidota bacterium]|nr:cupin domain-containing protein [Bacteroidota bacterium]